MIIKLSFAFRFTAELLLTRNPIMLDVLGATVTIGEAEMHYKNTKKLENA